MPAREVVYITKEGTTTRLDFYCHVCQESVSDLSHFADHVLVHLANYYADIIKIFSEKNYGRKYTFPLTPGYDTFKPFKVYINNKFMKVFDFASAFDDTFYKEIFDSEGYNQGYYEASELYLFVELKFDQNLVDRIRYFKDREIIDDIDSKDIDHQSLYSFDIDSFESLLNSNSEFLLTSFKFFITTLSQTTGTMREYKKIIKKILENEPIFLSFKQPHLTNKKFALKIDSSKDESFSFQYVGAKESVFTLDFKDFMDKCLNLFTRKNPQIVPTNYNYDSIKKAYNFFQTIYYYIYLLPYPNRVPELVEVENEIIGPVSDPLKEPNEVQIDNNAGQPEEIQLFDLQNQGPPPDDETIGPFFDDLQSFDEHYFEDSSDPKDVISYLFKLDVASLPMKNVLKQSEEVKAEYNETYHTEKEKQNAWHLDKRAKIPKVKISDKQHFRPLLVHYSESSPFIKNLLQSCPPRPDKQVDIDLGFNLRLLTQIVIHRFFFESELHALSCGRITIDHGRNGNNFLTYTVHDHCKYNTVVQIAKHIFPKPSNRFNENEYHSLYRTIYHLFRAIYYYYGFKLYKRDLNHYHFLKYFYHALDNNVYHPDRYYIQPKFKYQYRRAVGQRIFVKELKKLNVPDFPDTKATDSSRLAKNADLLQLRAFLADDRDLITEIINQLYTGIITQDIDHGPVRRNLFDWYLPKIYYDYFPSNKISVKRPQDQFKIKFSYNSMIFLLFYFNYIQGKDETSVDCISYKQFIFNVLSPATFVIGAKGSKLVDHALPITELVTSKNNSNEDFVGPSAFDLLFGKRKNTNVDRRNDLIQHADQFKKEGFDLLYNNSNEDTGEVQDQQHIGIEQLDFNRLYEEYYFNHRDHIPKTPEGGINEYDNTNYAYADAFKGSIAEIISRTIRSDLPGRMLRFFIIHKVIHPDNSPESFTQYIKFFRNREESSDFANLVYEELLNFYIPLLRELHTFNEVHHIVDKNNTNPVTDITDDELVQFRSDLKKIIKKEISPYITQLYGSIRAILDRELLNNPSFKEFFTAIPVRNRGRKRSIILENGRHVRKWETAYWPIGSYPSRQRQKIRAFFHLTNRYFTQQDAYIDLVETHHLLTFKNLQANISNNIHELLINTHNPLTLPLPLNEANIPPPEVINGSLRSNPLVPATIETITSHSSMYGPQPVLKTRVLYLKQYLHIVRSILKKNFPDGHYPTDAHDYPLEVRVMLSEVYQAVSNISITKIVSVPRKKSLMTEFTTHGRNINSGFEISLLNKDSLGLFREGILDRQMDAAPESMDILQATFKPFGKKNPISFTFVNWFNKRIRSLNEQFFYINEKIAGNEHPDYKVILPPIYSLISPDPTTQLKYYKLFKQRQIQYFSYCNESLANFIIQGELKDFKYLNKSLKTKIDKINNSFLTATSVSSQDSAGDHLRPATPEEIQSDTEKVLKRIKSFLTGDYKTIQNNLQKIKQTNETSLQNSGIIGNLIQLDEQERIDIATRNGIPLPGLNAIFNSILTAREILNQNLTNGDLQVDIKGLSKSLKDSTNLNGLSLEVQKLLAFEIMSVLISLLQKHEKNPAIRIDNEAVMSVIISSISLPLASYISVTQLSNMQYDDARQLIILRNIVSNIAIHSGFMIYNFDYSDYDFTENTTGTIQLIPDKKLGSTKVFLKITFPKPPKIKIPGKATIMGIDLGLRDLCAFAIRTKGINTGRPDILPDILADTDFIKGQSFTPKYHQSARRLNNQSRFLQKSLSKYQRFLSRSKIYVAESTFASHNKKFFYAYNLKKAISSLQLKKSNINTTTVHLVTSDLLKLALRYKVKQFIFEDLADIPLAVPSGAKSYSYRYSSNLFGQVQNNLLYKSSLFGYDQKSDIILTKAAFTSQICPLTIIDSNLVLPDTSSLRQDLVNDSCMTYSLHDQIPESDRHGELFIHSYHHILEHFCRYQITLNRDVAAATVLTYGQRLNNI